MSDIWLGTDLDIFLIGEAGPHNLQKLQVVFDAVRAHTLEHGKYKTLLATRTDSSVSIFTSAEEAHRPPPVQVILHAYKSLEELLARFDVDCCACAFDFASDRFVWSERCRRAFVYGAVPSPYVHSCNLGLLAARQPDEFT